MSNRRKIGRWTKRETKRRKRLVDEMLHTDQITELTPPDDERVIAKRVPAMAGDEEIGEAIIYEDGTIDIVAFRDISDEGTAYLEAFKRAMSGTEE